MVKLNKFVRPLRFHKLARFHRCTDVDRSKTVNKSTHHTYPRMQLRTAFKGKSTTQKLVMTVNFYQTVNMSSKTLLVYQNNLSIKKMKFIKFMKYHIFTRDF